jgi:hypothetical protein
MPDARDFLVGWARGHFLMPDADQWIAARQFAAFERDRALINVPLRKNLKSSVSHQAIGAQPQ